MSNEVRVQKSDSEYLKGKLGFVVDGIEYGLDKVIVNEKNDGDPTGASTTDGAANKAGNDLAVLVGATAQYKAIESVVLDDHVDIQAKEGDNPEKAGKEENKDREDDNTRN